MIRFRVVSVLAFFLSVLMPGPNAQGATFKAADNVFVTSPVQDDLYAAGGKIVIEESIAGDAVVTGGNLIIRGDIAGDLMVAGGNIIVNGSVSDDVRAAGGDFTLTQRVGGDLIVFAGNVAIGRQASITGDLVAVGGRITLDGTVEGNLKVSGGDVQFNGTVKGGAIFYQAENLDINGSIEGKAVFAAQTVNLGPSAGFHRDVEYWAGNEPLDFTAVRLEGEARFKPSLQSRVKLISGSKIRDKVPAGFSKVWFLYTFLAGTLAILILCLLPKKIFVPAVDNLRQSPLKNLGIGVLYVLVTPFLILFLLITVLGIPIGLLLAFVFGATLLFSKSLSAVLLAKWVERRKVASWSRPSLFLASVGILLLLKMAGSVPAAGWLLVALVVCTCLGSLMAGAWEGVR